MIVVLEGLVITDHAVATDSGTIGYQWFKDGELIPGATGATYTPTEVGTHRYNVKVKADSCDDDVSDGLDTVLTTEGVPVFGGHLH